MKASVSKETREGHEEWGREGKRKNSAGVYMCDVLHRLIVWILWSPTCGTDWGVVNHLRR